MIKDTNTRIKQILLAVVIGFLALMIFFLFTSYKNSLADAENTTLLRLGGIVNSLALQIDGDKHQAVCMKYLNKDEIISNNQDTNYFDIHQVLKRNHKANMLQTPIYTIIFDTLSSKYVFGVSSADKPYFRHIYDSAPKKLMEKQLEGAMIPMYKDEFGSWLSAFAPIKNHKGQVVGLVQADEHFDVFLQKATANAFKSILMSLLVFIVLFLSLLRILNNILRKEKEDKIALAAANKQILQLDNFRKEMIANISHDLRTPLSSILGYAETLVQKNTQLNENDKLKYLNVISNEAKRLNKMVGELFDLTKLEAGEIKLDKEKFIITELAQDILYKYTIQAQEKGVRLITDFQNDIPMINADIRWIDCVLQNLMDNALKFVDNGGFVKFTIYKDEGQLQFKVCNTGPKIDVADIPFIFDRYFKATNTRKDSTGLGLAIVKKIIDLHHGTILCEVNEYVTTFRFTLPL